MFLDFLSEGDEPFSLIESSVQFSYKVPFLSTFFITILAGDPIPCLESIPGADFDDGLEFILESESTPRNQNRPGNRNLLR